MSFKKGYVPWNKGRQSWNKGIPMSKKAKRKSSISHKGMHNSPTTQFKKGMIPWNKGKTRKEDARIAQPWLGKRGVYRGEKNHLWKGGITPENKMERVRFRNTMQKLIFERDDYTCQLCGERGGELQVDHIQSWADYVELRFSMENCRTLCMDCHYEITFGKPKPKDIVWGHNLGKGVV